jgi:D-glycero-D-manno-heptose 1,7-bisphosphate phosphatase
LNVELAESFAIGDSERDIEAGRRAGCRTILIAAQPPDQTVADTLTATALDAARQVIAWERVR